VGDFGRLRRRCQRMTSHTTTMTGMRNGPSTITTQITISTRPLRIEVSTFVAPSTVSPGRQAAGVGVGWALGRGRGWRWRWRRSRSLGDELDRNRRIGGAILEIVHLSLDLLDLALDLAELGVDLQGFFDILGLVRNSRMRAWVAFKLVSCDWRSTYWSVTSSPEASRWSPARPILAAGAGRFRTPGPARPGGWSHT